jgi:hypothetical protein
MATKRKKKIDPVTLWEQDEVLIALKERYFKIIKKENIGKTPQITATLDKLELAINTRKTEVINENS